MIVQGIYTPRGQVHRRVLAFNLPFTPWPIPVGVFGFYPTFVCGGGGDHLAFSCTVVAYLFICPGHVLHVHVMLAFVDVAPLGYRSIGLVFRPYLILLALLTLP